MDDETFDPLIQRAMLRAVKRMRAFYEGVWPHEPVLAFVESEEFEASITRNGNLVLHVAIGCLHALERCRTSTSVTFDIETALEWLILHELHHADLGHFEMLRDVPVLNLVTRSSVEHICLTTIPKEEWSKIPPCLELQTDHDAIEILLGVFHEGDWRELNKMVASIASVIVLIEQADPESSTGDRTHPKAATRLFQLLGHLAEMPLVWSQVYRDVFLIPGEEELQAFARNVTILYAVNHFVR